MGNEEDLQQKNNIFMRIKEQAKEKRRREIEAQKEKRQRFLENLRRQKEIRQRNIEIERENNRRRIENFKQQIRERHNRIREENVRRQNEIRQNLERERERADQRRIRIQNEFLPLFFNNQNDIEGNNRNNFLEEDNSNIDNFEIGNLIINNNINEERNKDNQKFATFLEELELTQDIINKAESKECPICLEEYSINNKICYLPCFHFFHSLCIKKWLNHSKKCPLCNIDINFDYLK